MTRFGVMKHLAVLEEAGLVVTEERPHEAALPQPGPIREIHDRWISKYAEPTVAAMVGLRRQPRNAHRRPEEPPDRSIRGRRCTSTRSSSGPRRAGVGRRSPIPSSPGGTSTARRFESSLEPGAPYRMVLPDGSDAVVGHDRGGRPAAGAGDDVARALRRGAGRGAAEPGRVAAHRRAATASPSVTTIHRDLGAQPDDVGRASPTAGSGSSTR